MKQFRALRVVLCASVFVASAAGRLVAQATQQGSSSPIDDLLLKAQQAYNDLNYLRADSIAREVMTAGGRITQRQRSRALMVIAAAQYPEEAQSQKRADAIATLRQIVRMDIDAKLPQELTWAGLDSLLADTKRTTFGVALTADSTQTVVGPTGRGEIRIRSNRPANFRMSIVPAAGGAPIATDSALNVTSGSLHFATMRNDRPIFETGEYDIIVTGADAASGDTAGARYVAKITAPPLTFAKVPVAIDSSRLQLERTGKYGAKGIIVGALVGAGIYGFSNVLRADTNVKKVVPADSKGMAVAAASGLAVIIASFADHGRPIPTAIMANEKLRTDLAASIRQTQAENAGRITNYQTIIVIQTGAR